MKHVNRMILKILMIAFTVFMLLPAMSRTADADEAMEEIVLTTDQQNVRTIQGDYFTINCGIPAGTNGVTIRNGINGSMRIRFKSWEPITKITLVYSDGANKEYVSVSETSGDGDAGTDDHITFTFSGTNVFEAKISISDNEVCISSVKVYYISHIHNIDGTDFRFTAWTDALAKQQWGGSCKCRKLSL